jgi:hypothetical protein
VRVFRYRRSVYFGSSVRNVLPLAPHVRERERKTGRRTPPNNLGRPIKLFLVPSPSTFSISAPPAPPRGTSERTSCDPPGEGVPNLNEWIYSASAISSLFRIWVRSAIRRVRSCVSLYENQFQVLDRKRYHT